MRKTVLRNIGCETDRSMHFAVNAPRLCRKPGRGNSSTFKIIPWITSDLINRLFWLAIGTIQVRFAPGITLLRTAATNERTPLP